MFVDHTFQMIYILKMIVKLMVTKGSSTLINIGLIGTMEEAVFPINKVKAFDEGHKHGKIC
jgi:hypothetical protein